jgi:superfamily II DNA or RNA helicase
VRNQLNIKERIALFRSLFNGRKDVYATRWVKGKKSGYMPAYSYDPYQYRRHKLKGGTFQNFSDKSLRPLQDEQILKHLEGEVHIGIYPLLDNNASWFITADFDKDNWESESKSFVELCTSQDIPVYLERSQSGNGGHVWMFFEAAYPAIKSRRIVKWLLEQSGTFSIFDKTSSFDRLFPSQDYHAGKGFGNLIALPFYKPALDQNNSCFVDPNTFDQFEDQWSFLQKIQRVSIERLDQLYDSVLGEVADPGNGSNSLTITLDKAVSLNRQAVTPLLINFLKEEFNLVNSEYFVKQKSGKSTWNIQRYIKLVEETDNTVCIPRGAIGKLLRFCKDKSIDYDFDDKRTKLATVSYTCDLNLRAHQSIAIEAVGKKDFGVIVAPPGTGKTVIGLKLIAKKGQPALIVVHRKQLFEQWMDRIESFLKISKKDIGRIGHGKLKIGKHITVAMIQSLGKKIDDELAKNFKTIVIDECHHIPANTYQHTIARLNPYYQYGLTATPFRKYDDGKLIFAHLGEIIIDIKPEQIEEYKRARIIVRNTNLNIPFNSKTDQFETLSNVLIHDSARNKLILKDVTSELNAGKRAVIITERKEHIKTLAQYLKQTFEVITLSGDDNEKARKHKWITLNKGDYQVLITTGQFFGEGVDIQNVSRLFLVYPFSFKGKLIQYIGRVQRNEVAPLIYDYRDHKIDYLNKMFLRRNTHYRFLDKQASLFDDIDDISVNSSSPTCIDKKIKVLIDKLDFRYGSVAFSYTDSSLPSDLTFEIENDHIRPEFDVLKTYLSKSIGINKVEIDIHAEFEEEELIAQSATSADLDRINRELIESVRFRFVEKRYFGGKSFAQETDASSATEDKSQLYGSSEEMLEDILSNKAVKHYRQLRYLADRHERSLIKLRFVLNPFAFVFLLKGNHQFHLILETLDTEEATYIWHFSKEKGMFKKQIMKIDEDLNLIRNKGRNLFLESEPSNFSRVIHDYSDERKGFVLWRDLLEEKLY